MKKFIIMAILAAMPFATFAQTDFDKFQDQEGIEAVVITENLVNMLNEIKVSEGAKEAQPYIDKIKNIESLKVFTTSKKKHAKEMRKTVTAYLEKHPMDKLVSVHDDGSKVDVYMVTGEKTSELKELLVFTESEKDNETVLVSIIGNIDLADKK